MKNSNKKYSLFWLREKQLECVIISLELYKKTKDKKFYEFAKDFGSRSEELKKQLTTL